MINKLKPKSEFSRNVLTLMTGTTISQAIPIAISPILTRIYTPEDFGIFALYMSLASILAITATGRYELAILLPKKDIDAINLVVLSMIISCVVSVLTLIIVSIFNTEITQVLGNPQISNWLYFIPISILLTSWYQSFNYWNNRKKEYKRLAISRVIQSSTTSSANLTVGFVGVGSAGLVLGSILGRGISTYILGKIIWKEEGSKLHQIKKLKILSLAKRYIHFPKFDVVSSLANVFSQQIIHILFNVFFTATVAGYYYMTQRILNIPLSFLASAISDVFKEQASKDYKDLGHARKIYKSTFIKLFILSVFPSLVLYFFAVDIFVFVFGKEWGIAGEYASILTPMLFIKFISSPLSFMLYIGEKQKLNLYSQLLFLISIVASFMFGDNPQDILKYITLFFSLIYIYYIYVSAKIARIF